MASLTTNIEPAIASRSKARRDNPWLNSKLLFGVAMIVFVVTVGVLGRLFWDPNLAFVASSPPNLPPVGVTTDRGLVGIWNHPLGTEKSGRDILALLIVGAPNTLMVGLVASTIGVSIGIVLGFSAGFLGGWVDDIIRLFTDTVITVPSLLVLIVIQSVIPDIGLWTMAILLAMFAWPGSTRVIRAQVLTMRESGYVLMAKLSGVPSSRIMFREIMPNLLPYLAASFIASSSHAILASIGLEVLGLGPQRSPTLGVTIYNALNQAAILRGMWWWWGFPAIVLIVIFLGLLLINLGLDEVANPRLRRSRAK